MADARTGKVAALPALDASLEEFGRGQVEEILDQVAAGLARVRATADPETWPALREGYRRHPFARLVLESPLARRARENPRGYRGDPETLDYVYAWQPRAARSSLGEAVYSWEFFSATSRAVRARRDRLAEAIDRAAEERPGARVLSVACGHLREAAASNAVRQRLLGELVAFDRDASSLARVRREQGGTGVRTVEGGIRDLIRRPALAGGSFDLVYSAGLYDYLPEDTAACLTRALFRLLRPGGRLLLANLATDLPEAAYMETFLDWPLVLRDEPDLREMAWALSPGAVASLRIGRESTAHVVFLDLVRSGAKALEDPSFSSRMA